METNTRLQVKYSYYRILILDTTQPIINSNNHMKSYGMRQNTMKSAMSLWIGLEKFVMRGRTYVMRNSIENNRMFQNMKERKE